MSAQKKLDAKSKNRRQIFSMSESLLARLKAAKPSLAFGGATKSDWREWRKKFSAAVREGLGPMPEKVPLAARVLERKKFKTYIREKIVFNSERFMSVPAWVCSPAAKKRGQKFPAALCCHGHGIGKNPMVALDSQLKEYREYNKAAAIRLAENGYVAIAPDWRGMGERSEPREMQSPGRDICNVLNLATELLGFTLLGLNMWDGMRCIDYLVSRSDVDSDNIGCFGCSFGGTMTTYVSAMDGRVKAACVSGYLGSIINLTFGGNWGICGSQTLPGLLKHGGSEDVAGLICPRALLVQTGKYDGSFPSRLAIKAYKHIKKIYEAAGVPERVELDHFNGVHELNMPAIIKFFDKWLKQ